MPQNVGYLVSFVVFFSACSDCLWRMSRARLVRVLKVFTPPSPPLPAEIQTAQVSWVHYSLFMSLYQNSSILTSDYMIIYVPTCILALTHAQKKGLWVLSLTTWSLHWMTVITVCCMCALMFLCHQKNLWEEALLCLSLWTQTSRWEYVFFFLFFSENKQAVLLRWCLFLKNNIFRWQRTACTLWKSVRPTLQPLAESSLRSHTKMGCFPWCLTPCTVSRCGLVSHLCC